MQGQDVVTSSLRRDKEDHRKAAQWQACKSVTTSTDIKKNKNCQSTTVKIIAALGPFLEEKSSTRRKYSAEKEEIWLQAALDPN